MPSSVLAGAILRLLSAMLPMPLSKLSKERRPISGWIWPSWRCGICLSVISVWNWLIAQRLTSRSMIFQLPTAQGDCFVLLRFSTQKTSCLLTTTTTER
jgi:hypothetical protein